MEPEIKLVPTMKPTGKSIVLSINKLTLPLLELFCIPIINNKNKHELNNNMKTIFLNVENIFPIIIDSF